MGGRQEGQKEEIRRMGGKKYGRTDGRIDRMEE